MTSFRHQPMPPSLSHPPDPRPRLRPAQARPLRTVLTALGALISVCSLISGAHATDWGTYAADNSRSNVSPDPLPGTLAEAWTWVSTHPPQPAWQGEAKWDGWNKVYNLKPRQAFDRAFHPVIVGDRVFFGSSADDKVYCLDARTGKEVWTFYTEGPVRLAPTATADRLWFGSDDGLVYCLESATGKPVWQTRLGPADRRIPGNGRLISTWPVRTSVLVRDGIAYATAGMFPSEGIHIVALDATNGSVRWRQIQKDLPAQGYLLASSSRLYIPAGRDNPVVCDLADGRRIRVVEGAGGTYALLAGDALVFGPGKTGQLGMVEDGSADQLATFQGHHMIVTPDRSFLQTDTEITALDRARYLGLARDRKRLATEQSRISKELRKLGERPEQAAEREGLRKQLADLGPRIDALSEAMQNCVLWKIPTRSTLSLILAGETLVAGGNAQVVGFDTRAGKTAWTLPVRGEAYGLAASQGTLLVATDQGVIHALRAPAQRAALNLPEARR
jgi:outer membrane protein assembly factor BamB